MLAVFLDVIRELILLGAEQWWGGLQCGQVAH